MTLRSLLGAVALTVLAPAAFAANPDVGGAPMFEDKNIVENAVNSADHTTLVAAEPWPHLEAGLLIEDTITLPVQINGKKRGDVTVARNAADTEIESAVLALDAVKRALDGRPPKRVIVVPQRIVNVVA